MKNTLLVIVVLFMGGCPIDRKTQPTPKVVLPDNNSTAKNSVKGPTLEEEVVGTYALSVRGKVLEDFLSVRYVLLEKGVFEFYSGDTNMNPDGKWKISKEGEIHVDFSGNVLGVRFSLVKRINKDKSK